LLIWLGNGDRDVAPAAEVTGAQALSGSEWSVSRLWQGYVASGRGGRLPLRPSQGLAPDQVPQSNAFACPTESVYAIRKSRRRKTASAATCLCQDTSTGYAATCAAERAPRWGVS